MASILILAEGQDPIRLGLAQGEVFVGRMPGNDLVLDDPTISRRHARIFRKGNAILLEDLGSRAGCHVGGRRITGPTPIRVGEAFLLGEVALRLEYEPAPAPSHGQETIAITLPVVEVRGPSGWCSQASGNSDLLLETLHDLSLRMVREQDASGLLRLLVERLVQCFGALRGTVLVLDESGTFRPLVSVGNDDQPTGPTPVSASLLTQTLERREAVVVASSQEADGLGDTTTVSVMNIPLDYDGELLGVVCLVKGEQPFNEGDLRLAVSLCNLAAAKAVYERRAEELRRREDLERRLEDIERRTRARTHLLAEVSHEIRSPLTALIGYAELALLEDVPPVTKGYLAKIQQVGLSLQGLLNDILDFSRAESGKLRMESIPFQIKETVHGVVGMLEPKAIEKGLVLRVQWGAGVQERLVGDPLRLGQILINLVGNALKFTQRGEVRIGVQQGSLHQGLAELTFEVADTGTGMTEDQLRRVFDPYVQAEDSTSRRFGGTGLGLHICKALVELMGGRLDVESRAGQGTSFRFTLRLPVDDGASLGPMGPA